MCNASDGIYDKLIQHFGNKVCRRAVECSIVENKIFEEKIARKIIILQHASRFDLMQNILTCSSYNTIVIDHYDKSNINFDDVCSNGNARLLIIDFTNYRFTTGVVSRKIISKNFQEVC